MPQTTRRCAFLSTDNLEDFFVYDRMLFEPLLEQGWQTEEISWRDTQVNWDDYDVVVVRSPWDYQDDPQGFMQCLRNIETSRAALENSFSLIQWNISKYYLKELEEKGVSIVPTVWFEAWQADDVQEAVDRFKDKTFVIKPVISANADDTFKLDQSGFEAHKAQLQKIFSERDFMLQPFLSQIQTEGEYSLFYFGGRYSHTILKVPKQEDFRVQEEHGGSLHSVEPGEELLNAADVTLSALPEMPLYARLDFVRNGSQFQVMEVELIEPSLYFNMDAQSPQRFVKALCDKYTTGA